VFFLPSLDPGIEYSQQRCLFFHPLFSDVITVKTEEASQLYCLSYSDFQVHF